MSIDFGRARISLRRVEASYPHTLLVNNSLVGQNCQADVHGTNYVVRSSVGSSNLQSYLARFLPSVNGQVCHWSSCREANHLLGDDTPCLDLAQYGLVIQASLIDLLDPCQQLLQELSTQAHELNEGLIHDCKLSKYSPRIA